MAVARSAALAVAALLLAGTAGAQGVPQVPRAGTVRAATPTTAPLPPADEARIATANAWQRCAPLATNNERLQCFDQWAAAQGKIVEALQSRATAGAAAAAAVAAASPSAAATLPTALNAVGAVAPAMRADVAAALATTQPLPSPTAGDSNAPVTASAGIIGVGLEQGCKDRQFSDVSRFWELEAGSSCPTFSLRGFRANSLSMAAGSSVNQRPTSLNPANNASSSIDYSKHELRLQLSVRTKVAGGLLTADDGPARDSLWLAYSQQSYWQFFNSGISRPFRSTDYEPEVIYVYPTEAQLPFGWRWRYSGAGLVHQSNGQSDPLSRSWNRAYLMTGFEKGNTFALSGRVWHRLREKAADDNNPGITDFIGRGEIQGTWNPNRQNTLIGTLRGSAGGNGHGSGRIEWLRSLGDGKGNSFSGLRLHTQLFSGYGDSLIDYNRKRTVLSVGFSIVDF